MVPRNSTHPNNARPIDRFIKGGTRRFIFRLRGQQRGVEKKEIVLQAGDLLVMGGTTQETHVHQVPVPTAEEEEADGSFKLDRINYTVRAFL